MRNRDGGQIRHILAARRQLRADHVHHRAEPHHHHLLGIIGQHIGSNGAGYLDLFGVHHAVHADAEQFKVAHLRCDVLFLCPVRVDLNPDPTSVMPVHIVIEYRDSLLQLRVGAHHVIAFHEGFHRHFPVGRKMHADTPFGALAILAVGGEVFEHRPQRFAQTWRSIIMVDESTATPGFHPASAQRNILRIKLTRIEQVLAVNEGILPVSIPAPAVERTDEPLALAIAVAIVGNQRNPAVAAGVVIGFHAILGPHDDDRLAKVGILDPVPHFGDLLKPAGHLPDMRPQMIDFGLIEFRIKIAPRIDPLRIGYFKRNLPRLGHRGFPSCGVLNAVRLYSAHMAVQLH